MFIGVDFIFVAIGISIVAKAIRGGGRYRRDLANGARYPALPASVEDPRVPSLQAEVDELRAQVERLQAAESFYAQLAAPPPSSSAASAAPPAAVPRPVETGPRTS